MSEECNFKVIVALKSAKDQKIQNVRCAIQLMDKVKYTILPQSEGQFFEFSNISLSNPLTITFDSTTPQKRLGVVAVQIPSEVFSQEEIEIADIFTLEYQGDSGLERFTGRYYIIILNKGGITQPQIDDENVQEPQVLDQQPVKKEKKEQSPTKAYLLSSSERTQERQKKDVSKKLLKETKFDPPKKTNFTSFSTKPKTSSGKKGNSNQKSGSDAGRQFVEEGEGTTSTPKRNDVSKGSIEAGEQRQSPFQKYQEKSVMSSSQHIGELGAEVEYLKQNVVGLERQLKVSEQNKDINDKTLDNLSKSEGKRRELQQIIRESVQDNLRLKEEIQRNLSDMAKEKVSAEARLRNQGQQMEEQNKTVDHLKHDILKKDQKINDLLDKVIAMEEYSKICRIQQEKLEDQDKVIREQQQQFQKNIQELANTIAELEKQRLQAIQDKAHTDQTLQDLIQQLQRLKEHNVSLQSLLEQMERKYQLALCYEQTAKTLREQNNQLQNDLTDQKYLNDQYNALISELRRDIDNLNNQQENLDRMNRDKQSSLGDIMKGQENRINDLQNEVSRLKKDNLTLKEQNSSLQLRANLADDLIKQIDQYKRDYHVLLADNTTLTSTIKDLTDQLQLSNQQILELRTEVLKQSTNVQDQESYTNNLKRLMLEMQERGVAYIPVTGDQIDNKLAQWINKSQDSDKFRSLFVREGEGVYQFGNKKVYVKIEQDKILIRQGGGYMSIEEFLSMFSQREMDNAQRSDPLAHLAKNTAVHKKMDSMKQVNKMREEEFTSLKKK